MSKLRGKSSPLAKVPGRPAFWKWNLDEEISEEELSLLPEMRTDIVIEDKVKNTQLIIDTKYYA